MRTHKRTRILAFFLAVVMTVAAMPTQALAYLADKTDGVTIVDKDGNAITEDSSWEETFPYGTFAFGNSQLTVAEGEDEGVITLYRLGGTTGRAIAYVSYVPPAAEMDDGSLSYANTAGAEDVRIWVEDPLPIAQYQLLGKDPEPLEADSPAKVTSSEADASEQDAQEGDLILSLDQEAEAYQWQVLYLGAWEDISDATDATMLVGAEDAENYDFRCIYTVDGQEYGSVSMQGEDYVRLEESVPEMPDDIDMNPETTYSELEMDPDDPYQGQLFSVVFADGEWAKEIHVSAPEDDTAEPDKFGLFTIESCLGGTLYDSANTLTLHVTDNDEAGASTVGFAVTEVEADKAEGTVQVTVRREGDTSQVVTVDYETVDGTAVGGEDYLSDSGSLIFSGDVTEQTIEIQLIDDEAADETRLDFQVVITGVKGAGGTCTVGSDAVTVSLWNSGSGDGGNLATLLQDGEAADVSGGVTVSGGSTAPVGAETVTGSQVQEEEPEALTAEIVSGSAGGVAPMSFTYPDGTLLFSRDDYNYDNYWVDELWWAKSSGDAEDGTHNSKGYSGVFGSWSGGKVPSGGSLSARTYSNKGAGSITLPVNDQYFEEKFSGLYMRADFEAKWASGWINFWYKNNEWTYPYIQLNGNGGQKEYDNGGIYQTGDHIRWHDPMVWWNWNMTDDITSIQLGTKHNDRKDSEDPATGTIEQGVLYRRSLTNDLRLRIYTANDEDTHGSGALISSDLYGSNGGMQPTVTIVSGQGGVTSGGKLYVGSRLQIDLKTLESYEPGATGVDYKVFLTDAAGNVVKTATGSGTSYTIDLVWDNIDLYGDYTLNVVMTRKQDVTLDVTNSTPRLESDPSAVDTTRYGEAWELFWDSPADGGNNVITYGETTRTNSAPFMDSNYITTTTVTESDSVWGGGANGPAGTKIDLENLQWINFGRSADDYIVFNGRMYAGNETIWLEQQDLARGTLNFLYYSEDYLSVESAMRVNIDGAALYLDVNGNGRIDGYWDSANGIFVLDTDENGDTVDQFLYRLDEDTEYDERIFAPVAIEWDANGDPTKYAQFFLKVDYNLTPRCLVPMEGTDTDKVAQVLPAFVTSITDPGNYDALTEEQQSYRYIISGMTQFSEGGGYVRSGDGRPMYGAEATATAVIDIPLGGDTSPAAINKATEEFEWEPNYQGNLLYPFSNPEPIFIAHSLAGDNIPIAQINGYDEGTETFTYKNHSNGRLGVDLLNGYLGSFTANDTYALCVQEQTMTTDEIAKANGVDIDGGGIALQSEGGGADKPQPEGSSVGDVKTMPNSEYLKQVQAGSEGEDSVDTSEENTAYPEFNMDLGVQLPTADIGVTDFVTVIMDGNQVGFSIGLPLGGYNSNGDAGTSGVGGQGDNKWSGPAKTLSGSKEDMSNLLNWLKNRDMESFKENSDSYQAATADGTDKKLTAHGFTADFSVSMAFLFEYNALDNNYYFSQFSVTASAGMEFTAQYRFSPCPIFYIYITIGVGADLGTGATVERESVTGDELLTGEDAENSADMAVGNSVMIDGFGYKSFDIKFDGKVLIEAFSDSGYTQPYENAQTGYLESDGEDPVTVTMLRQDGQELPSGSPIYLKITALEEGTTISSLKPVTSVKTAAYYSGFEFSPEAFMQAGLGVGIEILKFEVYVKVSIGCSMVFAAQDADGVDAFSFEEFEFGLGLGFNVVLLFFSYEMDLIQYTVNYEKGDGWTHSWSALGGMFGDEISTLSATDSSGNTYGVRITLPGDASDTQTIYEPEYDTGGLIAPMAIDPPNGKDVPFQLSGYGATGDAFKLADGLVSGYDYQVVTANGENYLIYTISRSTANHALDNSMLVLSKLQLTASGEGDSYGLVNPVDPSDATPYILLDTSDGSGTDEGSGDLEFTAWADEDGVIHAAWVSYATAVDKAPPMPTVNKPTLADGTEMNEENYTEAAFEPHFDEVEPQPEDYYLTVDDYDKLTDNTEKARYVPVLAEPEVPGEPGEVLFYSIKDETGAAKYDTPDEAQDAFDEAQATYNSDKAAYDSALKEYNAWYGYYNELTAYSDDLQDMISGAAQNTVIKTAGFDPADEHSTGFSKPVILSGTGSGGEPVTGHHVFLPNVVDGDVAVYGKVTQHYSADEIGELKRDYAAYLSSAGYDTGSADQATAQIGSYRLSYQEGLWNVYGAQNALCVSVDGTIAEVALPEGQILDNLEAVKIGGAYYVAYTTSQNQYVNGSGSAVSDIDDASDMLTIKRLFLRTFTVDNGTITWTDHDDVKNGNQALLLRTLYDYELNEGSNTDGIYTGGQTTEYTDPYFANLQFLNAELGGALTGNDESFSTMSVPAAEDFLLFEMNGSTYVIRESSLESIAAKHTGSIIPFFTPADMETEDGTAAQSSTGRAEVTIGADGAGGLAAVYVGTVQGSTSNAIYITRYDPITGTWGAGTMLAMNHMQVYEDALAYGLSYEETELAHMGMDTGNEAYDEYIDSLSGDDKAHAQGNMDYLTFSNLQIALGQSRTEDAGSGLTSQSADGQKSQTMSDVGDMSLLGEPTEEEEVSLTAEGDGSKDTVLVITRGVLHYLTTMTANDGETLVVPVQDDQQAWADAGMPEDRKPGTGVYAISYGVGEQRIGEAELEFANYDFSAGSELNAYVTFVNTGDAALRASNTEPMTVTLTAGSMTLATWEITDNVLSGQRVELTGDCTALTADLAEGTEFKITVAEDEYFADPAELTSESLLTVGEKVELGFEDFSVRTIGVDDSGNAQLYVDMEVSNRGSLDAEDVYLQFSYASGTDENGEPIYTPLDLTGNTLEVGTLEKLPELSTMSVDYSLANGVFYLYNSDEGSDDIDAGYFRSVSGTILAPASAYANSNTGGMNLRVEIYSKNGDIVTSSDVGIIEAEHDEYNTSNNERTAAVGHGTFFDSASRVALAMGNTMRLPVSIATTTGQAPNITVVEIPSEDEESHLGVLYYRSGSFANGRETGTLVIAPTSTGTGIIHLQDQNTNDIYAVAYTVTEEGEGINIYNDTDIFDFVGYDPEQMGDARVWYFSDELITWGGSDQEMPMNGDLSYGKVGASFTFETQAESIRLYFYGDIRVESTFPGFTAATYSAVGGKNGYVDIKFGENETNYTHTVTVTVTGESALNTGYAAFDRVIMEYGAGTPIPAEDADAPHIYWSRSFPETASVQTGETVELQVFVLDDNGLASVTVNGTQPAGTVKDPVSGEQFWTVPVTVTENGVLRVEAQDISGNRTAHEIQVDWFLADPQDDASAYAPGLENVKFNEVKPAEEYTISWNETPSDNAAGTTPTSEITQITVSDDGLNEAVLSGRTVTANGWYLVTVADAAPHDGQWRAQMVYMSDIDTSLPVVTLARADTQSQSDGGGVDLNWTASKDTASSTTRHTIDEVSLNGYRLDIPENQIRTAGTWHATHAGKYTLHAVDTAGKEGEASMTLEDVPVYVKAGETFFTVTNATNDAGNNGSVTVYPGVLLGGTYDEDLSNLSAGSYKGSYEWRLVKEPDADTLVALLADDSGWTSAATTFDNLENGSYTLYVRDANDKRNDETALSLQVRLNVEVGDERISLSLEDRVETTGSGGSSSSGGETIEQSGGERHTLVWSAEKGENALQQITSVTINGQKVNETSGMSLSGELPIFFGGTYELSAADSGGEGQQVTSRTSVTVENFPISVSDRNSLVTIQHPWNLAGDNGSVTVNWLNESGSYLVTGGLYDADASSEETGSYAGCYEWLLEPAFEFDSEARLEELKAEWLAREENAGAAEVPEDVLTGMEEQVAQEAAQAEEVWVTVLLADAGKWKPLTADSGAENNTVTGLKDGSYVLFIRDAQQPYNTETLFSTGVTLNYEHITITAEPESARGSQSNGAVTVEASGGYLNRNTYQYIIRPVTGENDVWDISELTNPLDESKFPADTYETPAWDVPDFTRLTDPAEVTDTSYNLLNTATLDGLPSGWYQVAVRPMLGVDADSLLELARLAAAYTAASNAADEAAENATEGGISRQVSQRIRALDEALDDWRDADEADKNAAWAAYTALIGNDAAVLAALTAWQDAGFTNGSARDSYDEAVEAYFTGVVTSESEAAASETKAALEAAKTAYETRYSELMQITETAYAGSEGEIGWANSATLMVYVDRVVTSREIEVHDLRYPDKDTILVRFTLSKDTLSDKAAERIISDNAEKDILFTSDSMEVRVPAGTLSEGDDLMAMLMPFVSIPEDTTGTVVQYTSPSGEQRYVPWSVVTLGKVWYIASEPGTYELVTNPVTFSDVSESFWGYDEVGFVAARELFQGVDDELFDPSGTMTRAMLVTVLGRLAGIDPADYDGQSAFSDVDADSWYGPYVAWAAENGVVEGVGDGPFAPDAPITREQMCTMLVRYLDSDQVELPEMTNPPVFTDQDQVSDWAVDAVDRFRRSGVVEGSDGEFQPHDNASRAEVAAIFSRLITIVLTDG